MNNKIKEVCDTTISNYRYAVQNLRYDGDYINHFSALLNGYHKNKIPINDVKEIRTLIKKKTSKVSAFRGDIIYILSFLIANDKEENIKVIDNVLETYEMLIEEGFTECEYLIIASYSIAKYSEIGNRNIIIKRAKNIFNMIKQKYGNFTKEDDYLLCSLLAINGAKFDCMTEYMEFIFNHIKELKLFSNNGVQGLTNSILLNNGEDATNKVSELVLALEKNDLKIGSQFLQLLGILIGEDDVEKSICLVKGVIEYLSAEESQYNFYIDKDFRNMIALVIVFMSDKDKKTKYVDELMAFGTYSFLLSKNHKIFNEVLA